MQESNRKSLLLRMPVLPLRGMMVFPHMVLHFDVGRPKSVAALEKAMMGDQRIFLVAQMDAEIDEPELSDLCRVGTIAQIKQVLNLPGDSIRVLVEGVRRGVLGTVLEEDPCLMATVRLVREDAAPDTAEMKALVRTTHAFFEEYCNASMRVSQETLRSVMDVDKPDQLADIIAANVLIRLEDRQAILEKLKVKDRLEALCGILVRETELADVEKQVQARIKKQIEKNQKDYYLREQIKAIQTELGDKDGTDVEDLRERLEKTPLNDEAREKAEKELERLSRMAPGTPEIGVSRTYVEWILDLPWGKTTPDNLDLKRARRVLEENHYGLEKVKERIIEYLAVLRMKNDMKGPILCFAGPPGVGKTSIVRAIAKAVGRQFVQMSLGGVRDEAEIRGHRRTYIGAMPGKIISAVLTAKSANPLILLDEVDKLASDFRGDPAAALLEALDPEQNNSFRDHYLDIPFDLSEVLFITTANTLSTIPQPLLDRMDVIELPSYTRVEKFNIAKRHLLPKQLEATGLKDYVKVTPGALYALIDGYTQEAGVRNLERVITELLRKCAKRIAANEAQSITITPQKLEGILGPKRIKPSFLSRTDSVGITNGLAWTSVGGEILPIEVQVVEGGSGRLELTGSLGEVMKESAKLAITYAKAHAAQYGFGVDIFKNADIHIHAPEGAIPKDGPSAGITLATALISCLSGRPVRCDIAMTGEITLHGQVLPIGGLKEKSMAAYKEGMKMVLIPQGNVSDLYEVDPEVKKHLVFHPVSNLKEVLQIALVKPPKAKAKKTVRAKSKTETGAEPASAVTPPITPGQGGGEAVHITQ